MIDEHYMLKRLETRAGFKTVPKMPKTGAKVVSKIDKKSALRVGEALGR